MQTLFFMIAAFSFATVSRAADDYSQCKSFGFPGVFSGGLNDKGDFDVDPKAQGVKSVTTSPDGNTETVVVDTMFGNSTNMTYVLTKQDGRVVSVETKMDPKLQKKLPKWARVQDPTASSTDEFGFAQDHCYLKRTSYKTKSGKEVVGYDHEACNNVLAAVKSADAKKVQECAGVIFKLQNAVDSAAKKIDTKDRRLDLGNFMLGMGSPNGHQPGEIMGAFMAASACSTVRKLHGMDVDPASDVVPAFTGGGIFVGGITGTQPTPSPAHDGVDSPKDPDSTPAP